MTKDMTACGEEPHYLGHRQRLRERFLLGGGSNMPDYELLELLLTYTIPRRDVKPLAKELVKKFGSFAGVINASHEELLACDGIKEASATMIKVIAESVLRASWQNLQGSDEPVINNWESMMDYCRSAMAYQTVEEFRIIFLNVKLRVIGEEIQQRGTVNHVSVHPREVIKSAIARGASAIIMVHNHPSGDVTPSKPDIDITKMVKDAGAPVGITLLDHVIISKYDAFSFKDKGIL